MNIYDTLNRLADELKQSEEYKNFKNAKENINLVPEYKIKISEFEKLRYEEQMQSIQTGKTNSKKIEEIQKLYTEIIQIPEIKKYFDAELKFNVLLGDINKTISEAVREVMT